jgi:hypothetical protein
VKVKEISFNIAKILTDALSNVLSPTPRAMTGRPWQELAEKMKENITIKNAGSEIIIIKAFISQECNNKTGIPLLSNQTTLQAENLALLCTNQWG